MLTTLITILLIIFIFGLTINGFYAATRGAIVIEEDGRPCKEGKVLRGWYFFWMQYDGMRHVYYNDENVKKLWSSMRQIVGAQNVQIHEDAKGMFVAVKGEAVNLLPTVTQVTTAKFKVGISPNTEWVALHPYKEYKNYKYPWWLRDAMAGCITCFTSFYGTGLYLLLMVTVPRETLTRSLWAAFYCDTNGDIFLNALITWFIIWMSLAWVNTVLWKKF